MMIIVEGYRLTRCRVAIGGEHHTAIVLNEPNRERFQK